MSLIIKDSLFKAYSGFKENRKITLWSINKKVSRETEIFLKELSNYFAWVDFEILEKDGSCESYFEYGPISFFGIPKERELDPFLKSLTSISNGFMEDAEVEILLFVASMCPHCPETFNALTDILVKYPVRTKVVFSDDCPERVKESKILSVPSFIIKNGKGSEISRWTGSIDKNDVIQVLKGKGIEELSSSYFINLLEQGKAEDVARIIFTSNFLPKGFVDLYKSQKWSVRLGAVVAAEFLNELSHEVYDRLIDNLLGDYDHCPVEVKGDILYLAGLSIKKSDRTETILSIAKDETDEIILEAAKESLESLRS